MQVSNPGSSAAPAAAATASIRLLAAAITTVYFTGGVATVLVDTLVPKFKSLFDLSYTQAMLTQFSFFLAYLVVSGPAGMITARIGFVKAAALGITTMAVGCLLFAPAAMIGSYWAFLVALFVLSGGTNIFQLCANPIIASLGKPERAHSRLTLGLAFNSLGTAVAPLIGAATILAVAAIPVAQIDHSNPAAIHAAQVAEAQVVQRPFLAIAALLVLVALTCWFLRGRITLAMDRSAGTTTTSNQPLLTWLKSNPRLALGVLAMFLYVGAEVSIGSILINYLGLPKTLGLAEASAAGFVSLYWLGALIGRFIGSFVLRVVSGGRLLAVHAGAAIVLILCSLALTGSLSAGALVAVGLCNSIMFPTIFTLSIENLGETTSRGSALICMAIVGGAVVPLLSGLVADSVGLELAPIVPMACYAGILFYGALASRIQPATRELAADFAPAGVS